MRIYSKRFLVPDDAVDRQGHVNNLAYVAWMQDVAIEHSAAVGWPMERHLANGAGWVVRAHFVEYLRPTCSGERMAIHIWVPEFTQRHTPRRYLFVRDDDTQLVARARPGHRAYGRGRLAGDFVMFTDMLLGRLRL